MMVATQKDPVVRTILAVVVAVLVFSLAQPLAYAQENEWQPGPLDPSVRCPVCGMFVAKYGLWITHLLLSDGSELAFDGVKDMMAYFHSPQTFGAPEGAEVQAIRVQDYYSLQWLDGRAAFYVVGSDVLGPMGHELIPFADRPAAETFLADHHGKMIYTFAELDAQLIESLRKGHSMMGKTGHHHQ